jgi:hypothetical protein
LQVDLRLIPDFQPIVPQRLVDLDPCRAVGPGGKTGEFLAAGVVGEPGRAIPASLRVSPPEPLMQSPIA